MPKVYRGYDSNGQKYVTVIATAFELLQFNRIKKELEKA
jgi:hypothetical protein